MSHAASRRRGLSGYESYPRLLHVLPDVLGGLLFAVAANLADHHHGVGIGILVEEPHRVNMRCADDRIAANTDARGLSDTQGGQLSHRFIGERPAARDHADSA